jgi:nicotinate-nucleotide--dimethylbenzimidazole phosphoribosyltransferase
MHFKISAPVVNFMPILQAELDQKTKPLHSLGRLESLALQIGLVQQTLKPRIEKPSLLVFAADHGIAQAGVSPYPQSVTGAMVRNFSQGGAAINVLTRQLGWDLHLINAGTLEPTPWASVQDRRLGPGTKNMLDAAAMSAVELELALKAGADYVRALKSEGCNTVAFGEMGIGNSSSAALLIHCLCDIPLDQAVSRGAGCDDEQLRNKRACLEQVLDRHGRIKDPMEALRVFGGFELAMIAGAALAAAEEGLLILVDGLIASAAVLVAVQSFPDVKPYLIFAHRSAAAGHAALLQHLEVEPLLDLHMRLGEGTGAALALPLLQSAAAILSEMATFASAEVAGRVPT